MKKCELSRRLTSKEYGCPFPWMRIKRSAFTFCVSGGMGWKLTGAWKLITFLIGKVFPPYHITCRTDLSYLLAGLAKVCCCMKQGRAGPYKSTVIHHSPEHHLLQLLSRIQILTLICLMPFKYDILISPASHLLIFLFSGFRKPPLCQCQHLTSAELMERCPLAFWIHPKALLMGWRRLWQYSNISWLVRLSMQPSLPLLTRGRYR